MRNEEREARDEGPSSGESPAFCVHRSGATGPDAVGVDALSASAAGNTPDDSCVPPRLSPLAPRSSQLPRSVFFASALCLACLGVIAVQTASVTSRQAGFEPIYLSRHLVNLGLAVAAMAWAGGRPRDFWRRAAWPAAGCVLLALVLVRVPGLGLSAGGATRWLRTPGFTVQPSEWAKLSLPLLAAWWLTRCGSRRASLAAAATAAATLGLVLRQPDLGTTVLLVAAVGATLWLGGWRLRDFAVVGLLAVPAAAAVSLRGYQMRRVEGLIATWRDWRDAPYQLKQSLIALAEGGPWGVGLGQGWQKLSFLPESHTDFVLAVVGEELGLLGIAVVAGFWAALLISGLRMAEATTDRFAAAVAGALVTMLALQAGLNAAVVSALIPPTGIPHPMLSYGGNSLLVTGLSLGMVLSLTRGAVTGEEEPSSAPVFDCLVEVADDRGQHLAAPNRGGTEIAEHARGAGL